MNKEDYFNEADGLMYCGKCCTQKQMRLPKPIFNVEVVACLCRCEKEVMQKEEDIRKARENFEHVKRLKLNGIQDKALLKHTFENDNGSCPQMEKAIRYVAAWEQMYRENCGLLLWGNVGTGKSFFAACIANALIEQFIPVLMTSLSKIINTFSAEFSVDKNKLIESFDRYKLLVIDDFGVERGTEYAIEQVYSVIDARYKSGKPLIITTNLTLNELKNSDNNSQKRIYSRVFEMCVPIQFVGKDLRKIKADQKLGCLKELLK